MTAKDWHAWHDQYDDPGSNLSQRLAVVQRRIQHALVSRPLGPLRVVSICAGQARDLLGVLATHPRARDVTARLVELDPRNAASAMQGVVASGLRGIELAFVTDPGMAFGVGAHRFTGVPQPLETGRRMFTFIGRERLRQLGLSSSCAGSGRASGAG